MDKTKLHFYGEIQKFDASDDGSLTVSGIASTESVDAQGESVSADAIRAAISKYMEPTPLGFPKGSIREMHKGIASGVPISIGVDDEGKTTVVAKILDKDTIAKIKSGVLKGFSIGGSVLKKVGNKVTEILLKEISLVDIPCNPESYITIVKFSAPDEHCKDKQCKEHEENEEEKKKSEKTKLMEQKALEKLESVAAAQDSLVKTVADLVKTVESLAKAAPTIEKVQADLGDLQKRATETQKALVEADKKYIIEKMQSEGRVAYSDEGIAYKVEDLAKMDLPLLKVLAKNSAILPTEAKAIYKGDSKPAIDPSLKGSDRVIKAWESKYASLDEMKKAYN